MSNTDSIQQNTVEWNQIDWRKVELYVFKLQKKIYQASIDGNVKKVRRLQKTLANSYRAKLLAVRKVSQDNSGKKTIRDLSLIKKHKYRKIWEEHFKKVNKQFEQSKWNWIEDIPTLV